jgi:hypothetical protein
MAGMGKHVTRVEIRPGVLVNMRDEDRKVWEKQQADEASGVKPDGLVTSRIETASVEPAETATTPDAKPRKR